MSKKAWTMEEDTYLLNTVNEYTSNGDPKAAAFKKASEILGRTPGACGYRWNSVLSKNLNKEKKENQQDQQDLVELVAPLPEHPINIIEEKGKNQDIVLETVIQHLIHYKENTETENVLHENHDLKIEQVTLMEENKRLEATYEMKKNLYRESLEQYEVVYKMFEQAESGR